MTAGRVGGTSPTAVGMRVLHRQRMQQTVFIRELTAGVRPFMLRFTRAAINASASPFSRFLL